MRKNVKVRYDNYQSKAAATFLAKRIETYWRGKGYFSSQANTFPVEGEPGCFGVRTNIQSNGFPPSS